MNANATLTISQSAKKQEPQDTTGTPSHRSSAKLLGASCGLTKKAACGSAEKQLRRLVAVVRVQILLLVVLVEVPS